MNHTRTLLTVSAVIVVALAAVGLYANREGATVECVARSGGDVRAGEVFTIGPDGPQVCTVDRGGLVGADNAVYWWFAAAATLVIAGTVVAGRRMWPS